VPDNCSHKYNMLVSLHRRYLAVGGEGNSGALQDVFFGNLSGPGVKVVYLVIAKLCERFV